MKSKEVEISRRGDEIVLREKCGAMTRAFEILASLPADLKRHKAGNEPPQKRKGL